MQERSEKLRGKKCNNEIKNKKTKEKNNNQQRCCESKKSKKIATSLHDIKESSFNMHKHISTYTTSKTSNNNVYLIKTKQRSTHKHIIESPLTHSYTYRQTVNRTKIHIIHYRRVVYACAVCTHTTRAYNSIYTCGALCTVHRHCTPHNIQQKKKKRHTSQNDREAEKEWEKNYEQIYVWPYIIEPRLVLGLDAR